MSVLLPVRNGKNLLLGAIGSILEQSLSNFELLVLDDGSTDGTRDVVVRLVDERVRVLSDGVQRGLSARLNEGIDLARGRYLARMDADDLSFPHRLERQARFLDIHPEVDLVATRAVVFRDATLEPIGMFPYRQSHEDIVCRPWRGFYMAHPSWMGRAQWFRRWRYRIPEVLRAEDQELLLRALPDSRYHALPDVLLAYRQGSFDFRKTLTARRSLLAAQLRLFRQRRDYGYASKALGLTAAKILADSLAAMPGCERVREGKREPLDEGVLRDFNDLTRRFYHATSK